jgi:hypothetical protein
MLLKSEAIAARQSLLTPPRHYSFHSMLATLMEDFGTPPGLQGAQRQTARQLAKQILDLQVTAVCCRARLQYFISFKFAKRERARDFEVKERVDT